MYRTRPSDLVLPLLDGDEAEQVEDVSQGDHRTDFREADSWHGMTFEAEAGSVRRGSSSWADPANREEEPVSVLDECREEPSGLRKAILIVVILQ